MADTHGGYRKPANPAPVSGPGRLSRRTDGGPAQPLRVQTDQPYGAREDMLQQERSAPMSMQDQVHPMPVPNAAPQYPGGDFAGPSQRPGEPITHGVDIGPGAGPEALGMAAPGQMPTGFITNMLQGLSATDTTGTLAKLYVIARQRGV